MLAETWQWHSNEAIGESGLGKSTLVNTLFNTSLYPPKERKPPSIDISKTVSIQSISADIEENGVRLRLTVVDTPGFDDTTVSDTDILKMIAVYLSTT